MTCKFTVAKRQMGLFPVDTGPTLIPTEGEQTFNFSAEGYAQAIRAGEKISRDGGGEVNVKLVCTKGAAALAYCRDGRCEVDAGGQRSTAPLAGAKRKRAPKGPTWPKPL